MPYTSKTKVENYLTVDIDSSFNSQVDLWITAVETYINNYTGKNFTESASDETRYYDGNGKVELDIGNFTTLTTVQILDVSSDDVAFTLTEGKSNDYLTFPYNSADGATYRLVMTVNSQTAVWLKGTRRIKIVGKFGHGTSVPEDISLAATILLAGIVEKGLKGGSVLSEDLGDYSVTFKNVDDISNVMGVKEILNKYKIWEL